ncbi:MAG TPA: toll/interleukin-1 receptor domain-containing protein [Thermoanaerobaculia bacterium]|nr:toll/interleukin-1 receptor domain-containing protein [Thermoanaerobaculia bacterium]
MPPPGLKPRVFISHSAKQKEAQEVRDALKKALTETCEVLLDVETFRPGDGWRSAINVWLGACDAAVILLSEDALKSDYVAYEASILAYRKEAVTPSLLLLPVLLGDVSPDSLQKSHLSPARLTEWQAVQGAPEQIVQLVLDRLKGIAFHQLTPVEQQARKIADQLRGVPDDILRTAAAKIDLPLSLAGGDPRVRLAIQLLSVGMMGAVPALLELRPALPAAERRERMARLIERIASSWVDLRCVGRIPRIAKGQEPVRAFGVNARMWDAARMYVICASGDDPEGTWRTRSCTAVSGEDFTDALVRAVWVTLRDLLRPDLDDLGPTERSDLALDLEALDVTGQPVIIGLERAGIDDTVLSRLRTEFPHVTFFLMMGPEIEMGTPLSASLAEMLFPRLLAGDEDSFQKQYRIFERAVRDR